MSEKLVERLRNSGEFDVRHAAADLIEQQAARIAEAEARAAHEAQIAADYAKWLKEREGRIAALEEGLRELLAAHDEDIGMDDHDDDDTVGWYGTGEPIPLTFGTLRRARALLGAAYDGSANAEPSRQSYDVPLRGNCGGYDG